MSLEFNDLLARPFHKNVKEELNRRRTLLQNYDNSPTLRNPYFSLRRITSLSNQENFDVEEKPKELKFWELTKYSKQGLADIVKKMEEGGNLKAPLGLTSVSLELRDYTFYEVTVEFLIPDIGDWKEFKDTWLIFGAPVEFEFGRKSTVSVEDNDDIRADREIREGIIANFSWQMGENLRTVSGSLTIFSSLFVELSSKAHPDSKESDKIASFFENRLKQMYNQPEDITIEDMKKFYGSSDTDVNNINLSDNNNDELERKFFNRTKNFYSVIDREKFDINLENVSVDDDRSITFSKTGANFQILGEQEIIRDKGVPFGVDIINKDNIEDQIVGRQDFTTPPPSPPQGLNQEYAEYIQNNNNGFIVGDGEKARNFGEWRVYTFNNDPQYPDINDLQQQRLFNNYGAEYYRWRYTSSNERLNTQYNFLSSTSLHKYILSKLNLDVDDGEIFNSNTYYYVSMRWIQDVANDYISSKYGVQRKDLISKYIIEDTRVRDLSFLGFGSSQPDRVLINPWNKKYSRTDYEVNVNKMPDDTLVDFKNYTPKNRYFKFDPQGQYTLLEDIFISAPLLVQIVNDSNSIMQVMEKIVNEIESSTEGLIQLQRIGDMRVSKDRYMSNAIRYYDVSTIGEISRGEEYHEFNLFDPKERIRDLGIQSSIDDSVSEYAYFQSLGKVPIDKSIFLYENTFYNEDGSVNYDIPPINNYVMAETEGEYGYDKEINEFYPNTSSLDKYDLQRPFKNLLNSKEKELRAQSQKFINSKKSYFQNEIQRVKDRVERFYETNEIDTKDEVITLNLLTYIQTYFSTIVRLYLNSYNNPFNSDNTTTIPLKVDITLDGISGIVNGNAFKINLESFPMGYNNINTSPLFVVSTLNHSISSNNDWETTIGGFLFIPSSVRDDSIRDSDKLKEIVDSNNLALKIIREVLEENINELLSLR